jgi:hypothetical protein
MNVSTPGSRARKRTVETDRNDPSAVRSRSMSYDSTAIAADRATASVWVRLGMRPSCRNAL